MDARDHSRHDFLKAVGFVVLALAGLCRLSAAETPQTRPNILFVMSDDHAAHVLSCYGSKINKTLNLDRLAKEGMRFNNCFCTNSICGPSRAVILTGKYSHLNGVVVNLSRNGRNEFDGRQQTFPKLLQQAGYQTALIGKWHLGGSPTGFDYYNILPGQGSYHDPVMIEKGAERRKHEGYVTDIITDQSLKWLKTRNKDRPFLLMCHHKAPHGPWKPDQKHAGMYEGFDIPEPETLDDDYATRCDAIRNQMLGMKNFRQRHLKGNFPKWLVGQALKKWTYQQYIKRYLRCVASLDDNVSRLLEYLDQSGLAENTIVVYTSDQGFFLGDHGLYDKRFMYEESLRMPLLVRYPKEVRPGSVNDEMVLNLDFAETFLDYAGVAMPADMQGRSFRPILRGRTPEDWRTSMYYSFFEVAYGVPAHCGLRTGCHKLIHFYSIGAWELYDLQKDPKELKNVFADPTYQDVVKQLKLEMSVLQKKYGESEKFRCGKPTSPIIPLKMKTLGLE